MFGVQNRLQFGDFFAQLAEALQRFLLRAAARVVGVDFGKLDFVTGGNRDDWTSSSKWSMRYKAEKLKR